MPARSQVRRAVVTSVALSAIAATTIATTAASHAARSAPNAAPTKLAIHVVSDRADLISGGNALVQVSLPAQVDPAHVSTRLNGHDVTEQFARRDNGAYEGLLRGLRIGLAGRPARMR